MDIDSRKRSVRHGVAGLVCCAMVLAVAWIAGCSGGTRPELGQVRGTVTLDGQPLAGATVLFKPEEGGRHSRGVTDTTGQYELIYIRDIKGAKVGPHKVIISTASELNPTERVPDQYHGQAGLVAKVQAGANRHDFDLKMGP